MKFSLKSARTYERRGEYGPAVANYMAVLKFVPANVEILETEFLDCFQKFVGQLETRRKIDQANEYLTLIGEFYQRSPRFLTLWGEFLARQHLYEEAARCFMKSLDLQPDHQETKRSLRNLRYALVDQWHFRMLNDRRRNRSYEQALSIFMARYRFSTPITVLDIGCGTGILSMLAAEAGARMVYACEQSSIMRRMAEKIFAENRFDEIILIEKHSKDVDLTDDLKNDRVDLIVTELMDAGFFGEGIVATLLDAKTRLLSIGGSIVPSRAKIWGRLIECESIRRSNTAILDRDIDFGDGKIIDNGNQKIDFGNQEIDNPEIDYQICSALCVDSMSKKKEPYTSIMLNKVKGGYRYISEAFLIDEIDLNDEEDLKRHQKGIEKSIASEVIDDGYLDAVACWFEVDLLPPSISTTKISICTKPENIDTCWEQAIFPVSFTNRKYRSGDRVEIDTEIKDNWMQCSIRRRLSIEENRSIVVNDLSLIESINDDQLFGFYSQVFEDENAKTGIIDLMGNPRVAFSALSIDRPIFSVVSSADGREICRSLEKSTTKSDRSMIASTIEEIENRLQASEKSIIDTLLFCPIDSCGLLKQNILEDVAFCRLRFDISKIVPESIDIFGLLIESRELSNYARLVDDQNTLGLKIKKIINVFETDIQRDLELSTLNFKRLSESAKLMTLNLRESLDGGDRLPDFLSQINRSSIEIRESGVAHGLIFWFEFSNGQNTLNTSDPKTHFRVAAALTNNFSVAVDDLVAVTTSLERSELYFNLSIVNLVQV